MNVSRLVGDEVLGALFLDFLKCNGKERDLCCGSNRMKREEEEVAPEGSFLRMASLNNPVLNDQLETSEEKKVSVIYFVIFSKKTLHSSSVSCHCMTTVTSL